MQMDSVVNKEDVLQSLERKKNKTKPTHTKSDHSKEEFKNNSPSGNSSECEDVFFL